MLVCSYDHVRDNKTPTVRTLTLSSNQNSESHGLQTSNCSASPRPVNLHTGASSDVTSQMTSLRKDSSSHHNGEGRIRRFSCKDI